MLQSMGSRRVRHNLVTKQIYVFVCARAQLCLTFCKPLDCSLLGSSVHGISQARILEWVTICYSRGSSPSKDRTCVSCISCTGRWILYHCSTWGYTHTHAYTHTHMHIYTHTHMHIYIHTYAYTHIYTHAYTHIYTHTCIYTHICIYTYTYMHIYIYTHAYIHTCAYIHIYIHTHTHI